jgi:hypothetical protein
MNPWLFMEEQLEKLRSQLDQERDRRILAEMKNRNLERACSDLQFEYKELLLKLHIPQKEKAPASPNPSHIHPISSL